MLISYHCPTFVLCILYILCIMHQICLIFHLRRCICAFLSQNQDDRMANTIGLRMKTESDADHVFFVFPRDLVLFLCIIMR